MVTISAECFQKENRPEVGRFRESNKQYLDRSLAYFVTSINAVQSQTTPNSNAMRLSTLRV